APRPRRAECASRRIIAAGVPAIRPRRRGRASIASMPRRRPRKAAPDPDAAVIAAALAEAGEIGWEALTLRRVAARAGLGLAALVRRFPSVDAIADAWLDRANLAMAEAAPALARLA